MRDAMLAAAKSGKLTEVLDELEPKAEEKEAVPAVAVPVAAVPVGPAPSSEALGDGLCNCDASKAGHIQMDDGQKYEHV